MLAPGFRISGLGQLVDAGIKADRTGDLRRLRAGDERSSCSSTASPVRHHLRAESLAEVVLIAATFDQDVSLVFLDDGVRAGQGPGHRRAPASRTTQDLPRARGLRRREAVCRARVDGSTRPHRGRPAGRRQVLSSVEMADLMASPGRGPVVLSERVPMLHIVNKSPPRPRRWRAAAPGWMAGPCCVHRGRRAGGHRRQRRRLGHGRHWPPEGGLRLQPDVEARGIAGKMAEGVSAGRLRGFVDLVAEQLHQPVLADHHPDPPAFPERPWAHRSQRHQLRNRRGRLSRQPGDWNEDIAERSPRARTST